MTAKPDFLSVIQGCLQEVAARREHLDRLAEALKQVIQLSTNGSELHVSVDLLPPEKKVHALPPKRKPGRWLRKGHPWHTKNTAVATRAPRAKAGAPQYTSADIVEVALELIKKEGPVPAQRITQEVLKRFSPSKTPVSVLLWSIVHVKDAKIQKVGKVYDRKSAVKHVEVTRTPKETQRLLEQARRNADRSVGVAAG